jgi:hypothetical protein
MTKRTKLVQLMLYLAGGLVLIAGYAMATTPTWHQRAIAGYGLVWVLAGILMTREWRREGAP